MESKSLSNTEKTHVVSGNNEDVESSVDTSPRASVSALRAKFASQGEQVMGRPRPQQKCSFTDRRTQRQFSSSNSIAISKSRRESEEFAAKSTTKGLSKTLPPSQRQDIQLPGYKLGSESLKNHANTLDIGSIKIRPPLHPKPFLAELNATLKQERTKEEESKPAPESEPTQKSSINASEDTVDETQEQNVDGVEKPIAVTKNIDENENQLKENTPISISQNISEPTEPLVSKKARVPYKRKPLPPQEKFGPPPLKPPRPPNVDLTPFLQLRMSSFSLMYSEQEEFAPAPPPRPSRAPPAPPTCLPPRPPPKRLPPPPAPPSFESPKLPVKILDSFNDCEELYEDTAVMEEHIKCCEVSSSGNDLEQLKQEFQQLCNNSVEDAHSSACSSSSEELYQDTNEDVEETIGKSTDSSSLMQAPPPMYANKSESKLWRTESKQTREEKEQERRTKELEKIRKKFGLTGEEIPVDHGVVKDDSRGGRHDLTVRKGETVLIIRMENNPQGKWLVKNERGKIGYVELANIEIDADSVKNVMTVRRLSMHAASFV